MGYVKLADLVAIDEIMHLMEVDAKPLEKMAKEDTVSLFWDAVFAPKDEEINQEDPNNDESSENSRTFWLDFDD